MRSSNNLAARVRAGRLANDDAGFTLVEVVVAVVILAVISASALAFAMQGLKGSHAQERVEIATTVATRAMEAVRAYNIIEDPNSHKSSLYNGRTQAAVQSAWTSYAVAAPGARQRLRPVGHLDRCGGDRGDPDLANRHLRRHRLHGDHPHRSLLRPGER